MGDDTSEQPGTSTAASAEANGAAVPRARTPAKKTEPSKAAKTAKTAKTAKATKATKTARPAKTTKTTKAAAREPAKQQPAKTAAEPVATQPAPAVAAVPATTLAAWAEAVREALRQPDQPPQQLAELAIAEFGPRAAGWADWLRATYPGVPPAALVRLAAQQAKQAGWLVAGAGVAGPLAPVLHPAASCAVRVQLVLRVAAAYGHDPTDPARAPDLLDLFGLDKDAAGGLFTRALGPIGRFTRLAGLRRRRGPVRTLLALVELGDERDRLERLAHRAARHFRSR